MTSGCQNSLLSRAGCWSLSREAVLSSRGSQKENSLSSKTCQPPMYLAGEERGHVGTCKVSGTSFGLSGSFIHHFEHTEQGCIPLQRPRTNYLVEEPGMQQTVLRLYTVQTQRHCLHNPGRYKRLSLEWWEGRRGGGQHRVCSWAEGLPVFVLKT